MAVEAGPPPTPLHRSRSFWRRTPTPSALASLAPALGQGRHRCTVPLLRRPATPPSAADPAPPEPSCPPAPEHRRGYARRSAAARRSQCTLAGAAALLGLNPETAAAGHSTPHGPPRRSRSRQHGRPAVRQPLLCLSAPSAPLSPLYPSFSLSLCCRCWRRTRVAVPPHGRPRRGPLRQSPRPPPAPGALSPCSPIYASPPLSLSPSRSSSLFLAR